MSFQPSLLGSLQGLNRVMYTCRMEFEKLIFVVNLSAKVIFSQSLSLIFNYFINVMCIDVLPAFMSV